MDDKVKRVEYRVDELARQAGTTVRNVRAYQDRGLLPPPRREGRIVLYSEDHLARLRLVGALLERGYTLANIAELLAAWERGEDVGALLGLGAVLGRSWSDEPAAEVSTADLAAALPGAQVDASVIERAVEVGILEVAGPDRFRVRNPRALEVGALLLASGVPLDAVLAAASRLRDDVGGVARLFVDLVESHVFDPLGDLPPATEVPRLARLVERLRPLALQVVEVELALAMESEVAERLGEHLDRFARRGTP